MTAIHVEKNPVESRMQERSSENHHLLIGMPWFLNPDLLSKLKFQRAHDGSQSVCAVPALGYRRAGTEEIVRQLFLLELVNLLHYPPDRLVLEYSVQMGSSRRRADIAILTEFGVLHAIVEIKVHSSPQSIDQLKSYMSATGAIYGAVVATDARTFLVRTPDSQFHEVAGLPTLPRTATEEAGEKHEHAHEESEPQVEAASTNEGEQENGGTSTAISAQSTMKILGIAGLRRRTQTSSSLQLAEVSVRIENSDLATYRTTRKRVLGVGHVWPLELSKELWAAVVEVLFAEAAPPENDRPSDVQAVQLFLDSVIERLATLFPESRDGWVSASRLYAAFHESEQALPISESSFFVLVKSRFQKKRRSSGAFYRIQTDEKSAKWRCSIE